MSKFVHAATAAAALLLFASPAAADPFQSFLKACVATDADSSAAISAVRDLGWKAMPAEAFPAEDEEIQTLAIYANFDPSTGEMPDHIQVLMTGQADGAIIFDAPGHVMEVCGVMAPADDAIDLIQQASDHFGGPPQLTSEGYKAWTYSRRDGRIVSEAALMDEDDAEVIEVLNQRPLFVVYVLEEDDMGGIVLAAMRKTASGDQ